MTRRLRRAVKIEVVMVQKTRKGLLLSFKDVLFEGRGGNARLNDMGMRVWRILRLHEPSMPIYDPGNETFGRSFLVESGRAMKGIETTSAAQAQMDKHANTRLTVAEFKPISVYGQQGDAYPKTMEEIKQAQTKGITVEAGMLFQLNLPVHERDCELLTAELKKDGVRVTGASEGGPNDACLVYVMVRVQDKNPWTLLRGLQPKIRATLVGMA